MNEPAESRSGAPLRWEELSWPEIRSLREEGIDMVILPVGATEQHGPHLPLGVDTFSAVAVAEGVSAVTGIPVLPALPVGCSLGHSQKWPGTLSLRPETLSKVVYEIGDWVRAAGFSRLLILNGHVTNWAPLRCALENLRADMPEMRIALKSLWDIAASITAEYERDGKNWHANCAETSLMLALRPELVARERAVDEPDRSALCFFSYPVSKESVTGTVGTPSVATPEAGEMLLDACVRLLAEQVQRARFEKTPLEEMPPSGMD